MARLGGSLATPEEHAHLGTVDVVSGFSGALATSLALEPETLYCVGPKDRHRVSAVSDLHVLSVFCPPLRGDEQHDADGALTASGPVPPGPGG